MRKRKDIEIFFQRVVRSAQLNSLGTGISLFLGILSLGVFFCTLSINSKFSKEQAIFVLVSFSLCSLCSFFWALRHWFRNQRKEMYAEEAEKQRPELRGSLLCALEIPQDSKPDQIHDRVIDRAHKSLQFVSVSSLVPKKTFFRSSFFFSASVLALIILQFILPLSSMDALASLINKPKDSSEEILDTQTVFAEVTIADITLHYDFPEYTKQESITVQNSDGTIHAPIGSKVRIQARVKEEFQNAYLQVHENEPLQAQLENSFLFRLIWLLTNQELGGFFLIKKVSKLLQKNFG